MYERKSLISRIAALALVAYPLVALSPWKFLGFLGEPQLPEED